MFKMKCEDTYHGWFFRVYHRSGKCILRVIKSGGDPDQCYRFQLNEDRINILKTIQRETANKGSERTRRVLELVQNWQTH